MLKTIIKLYTKNKIDNLN